MTSEILNALADKMLVHEAEKKDCKCTQIPMSATSRLRKKLMKMLDNRQKGKIFLSCRLTYEVCRHKVIHFQ